MLAIVNENDMVTRSDGPYIRSVVDLYRRRYLLPSTPNSAVNEKYIVQRATEHTSTMTKEAWPLPEPIFYLVGDIIILGEPAMMNVQSTPAHSQEMALSKHSVLHVAPTTFSKLLFCDIEVHRRRAYLQRLELLWKESKEEQQHDIRKKHQWLDDVLSWSDTDGSQTDDFCSLFTASTFSSSTTI